MMGLVYFWGHFSGDGGIHFRCQGDIHSGSSSVDGEIHSCGEGEIHKSDEGEIHKSGEGGNSHKRRGKFDVAAAAASDKEAKARSLLAAR